MNTNNENMTVLGLNELALLEEEAIDGSQDSARILYNYYLDPGHYDAEKASYWGSFLDEGPEPEETVQTPAEGMTQAEQWMLDYNNGITKKMMIRQLQERMADGDPFAAIIMAELYIDESEQGIAERLRYYDAAKNNAEKLNDVPGYNMVLYRLQLVMGDIRRILAKDPHDAHAQEAFRHYVNAADMSASLHDGEAYSRLISCYQEGFGCEQDPARAEEMHVKMYENSSSEGLLMLAKENQEQQNRLNAVDYLQRCLMTGEDYPDVMAAARFKLACMNMPADNGVVPGISETVKELSNVWTLGLQTFMLAEEEELFVKVLTENSDIEEYADSDSSAFPMYLVEKLIGGRLYCYSIEDAYIDNYYVYDAYQPEKVQIGFEPEGDRLRNTTSEMSYDEDYRLFSEKILKLCLRAAELGEAAGMYAAGKLYAAHAVNEPDAYTAGDWILKASEAGCLEALILMAQVYAVNGDMAKAASFLEQVMDSETAPEDKKRIATVNYAKICLMDGKEANLQTALEYYQEADEQEDPLAPVMLGKMYCNGMGVPQDFATARQYLQKGVNNGILPAMIMLADLYFEGLGGPADHAMAEKYYEEAGYGNDYEGTRLLRLGIIRYEAGDPENAYHYFCQAADCGNTDALARLAEMYRSGYGVSADNGKAAELLREAADKGNTNAVNDLGMMYEHGEGVPADLRTAYELYTKAAEEGNPYGMSNLGRMYMNGIYVQQDSRKAIEWYSKAYEYGISGVANDLAIIYMTGDDALRDVQQGIRWFEKGAEAGDANAAMNLARAYADGIDAPKDVFKSFRYYLRAAELGNAEAMGYVGFMYGTGTGVGTNYASAFEWTRKGAEAGDTLSMFNLANSYQNGLGTPRNPHLAAQWFQKLCDAGHAEAAYRLSLMYSETGELGFNSAREVQYLSLAAERGHLIASGKLGAHYLYGSGIGPDIRKGLDLLHQAAEQGDAGSMVTLGWVYWQGEKTAKDLETALYWYERAADAGAEVEGQIGQIRNEIQAKPKGLFRWFK